MSSNPFRYVNSLYTFISDVAQHVRDGDDIVVVTGPYRLGEIEDALHDLCVYDSTSINRLQSSKEILSGGFYRGLTFVRMLDEPLSVFRERCSENGLKVVMSPTGVSSDELSGYGLALSGGMKLESYKSVAIRLSAVASAGSIYFFRSFLEVYSKSERSRGLFVNPMRVAEEIAREQTRLAAEGRSYALDDMSAFANFIVMLADGSADDDRESVQSTFLWAWSRGMCWRHEGLWCIDWSLISYVNDRPVTTFDGFNEDSKPLFEQILIKRIGMAETTAMMPAIERYCAVAAARFVRQSCRRDGQSISTCEVRRSSQISEMRSLSKLYQDRWADYIECHIDMYEMLELRNCLCHLDPDKITDKELTAFRKALDVLNQVAQMPYDSSSSCAFM